MSRIEINGLSKSYGSTKALDNVSLTFEENRIYGLLGRNGAGKSTLLNIISNRLKADSGSVTINGESCFENDDAQADIYIMSEIDLYPEKMKVIDIFKWSREFYREFDIEYAKLLSEKFGLDTKKQFKALSTGYNSIVKLIIALSVNSRVVFFDEPVLGLDANNRDLFYRLLLEKYTESPFTAVISTHLIEEISNVIEDIIIIKDGKIIRNESCDELLSKGYTISGPSGLIDSYTKGLNVLGVDGIGGLKSAYILGTPAEPVPQGLEISKLDLQKLFIQLTND